MVGGQSDGEEMTNVMIHIEVDILYVMSSGNGALVGGRCSVGREGVSKSPQLWKNQHWKRLEV